MSDRDKQQSNKPDNPFPPQNIKKSRQPVAASDHVVENLTQFSWKKSFWCHGSAHSINILLLIGRDLGDTHHIIEQRIGPPNAPSET